MAARSVKDGKDVKEAPDAKPKTGAFNGEEPIIGIDLGMTSVIAAYVSGPGEPPRVIPAERNLPTLAAAVAFNAAKGPVVGRAAHDMLTTAPSQTVTGIKRLLGRKVSSQAVRDLAARVGFSIVEGKDGDAEVEIEGRRIRPPEVAGLLLDQTRRFAEAHLGAGVRQCVIAVPAYFNAAQKAAVKEAGELAGLEVLKLVHEPTAVALAYGYNKGGDARIVILDMGGIRLDVSVMEITGNVFDVVATGGDAYLGGSNLDARLAEWILATIEKRHGKDLSQEAPLLMKVRTAAEQAKRELSRCKAVDLQIPLTVGTPGSKPQIAQLRLTLETVERLADDLVARVVGMTQHVLRDRGLSVADIDDVILVGGATRIPLLKKKIAAVFGKEPRSSLPPEEVVALGAALLADSLKREAQAAMDVVRESIGIALSDGRFMKIIDKNSRLPITRRVMIPTVRDHQHTLEVDLFQGDAEDILDTEYLGSVCYSGIAEGKAGESKVVVDLIMGSDRVLTITSPEDGRDGERFDLPTKFAEGRKEPPKAPFILAKKLPALSPTPK